MNSNGTLSNSIGGVQAFFNGYPAPMIYALAGQLSAVVPYEIAGQTSVNLVVVYQGNASEPFAVPVAPAKPGIFTNDASGKNQGAILNQDYSRNGPANPAPRGQYVFIYGTGEGVTSPPGVDGRISATPLPQVNLTCTATIGGANRHSQLLRRSPRFHRRPGTGECAGARFNHARRSRAGRHHHRRSDQPIRSHRRYKMIFVGQARSLRRPLRPPAVSDMLRFAERAGFACRRGRPANRVQHPWKHLQTDCPCEL